MNRACFVLLGLAVSLTSPLQAQDLFLTNARIVDPAAREIRGGNLLITNGIIVGEPNTAPAGFSGETIDLAGKWVIPGLNDLHTHSYGNMAPGNVFDSPGTPVVAKRVLYVGVTGLLDLFGREETLYAFRERQREGGVVGADLFASLSCLTATDGHCTEYGIPTRTMDSPDDARRTVADLVRRSPDVVKIIYAPTGRMPSIDGETLAAAVSTANERGLKTVIHVNTWQDVRDAVAVGASAVTHVPADSIPDDLAPLMAQRGVYSIPTLAVETDLPNFVAQQSLLENSLAAAVTTDAILAAYRSDEIVQHVTQEREHGLQRRAKIFSSVKKMADAGVTILAGTDSGNWGTIQGFSVHRELVLLVDAGLSTWQALAAATTLAGEFLSKPFGVRPGDEANLVVLDASPIENIHNTQRIAMVIHQGKVVNLEQLLMVESSGSN